MTTYVIFQDVDVLGGLVDDVIPHLVGQLHVALDQRVLLDVVGAGRDHVAHGLVECMNLELRIGWLQLTRKFDAVT